MAVRINSTPLVIGKPLHQRFGSTSDTAGPISLGANPSLHFTYFFRIQRVRLSCSQHGRPGGLLIWLVQCSSFRGCPLAGCSHPVFGAEGEIMGLDFDLRLKRPIHTPRVRVHKDWLCLLAWSAPGYVCTFFPPGYADFVWKQSSVSMCTLSASFCFFFAAFWEGAWNRLGAS